MVVASRGLRAVGLEKLNGCSMAGRSSQSNVTGNQWVGERFCEGQVGGIISSDVMS